MAIKKSPVIDDDSTDYPEESVENKEREVDDYVYELEKEIKEKEEKENFDYPNEEPSEEFKVDPELPGNISFSFV